MALKECRGATSRSNLSICLNCGPKISLHARKAMRKLVGIDPGAEACLNETAICKFPHISEVKGMEKRIFASIKEHLKAPGSKIGNGTIVDAKIITAPSSTKNHDKKRDPEIHQARKGNQWYLFRGSLNYVKSPQQKINPAIKSSMAATSVTSLRILRARIESILVTIRICKSCWLHINA